MVVSTVILLSHAVFLRRRLRRKPSPGRQVGLTLLGLVLNKVADHRHQQDEPDQNHGPPRRLGILRWGFSI